MKIFSLIIGHKDIVNLIYLYLYISVETLKVLVLFRLVLLIIVGIGIEDVKIKIDKINRTDGFFLVLIKKDLKVF